jgi:hypothetical protein
MKLQLGLCLAILSAPSIGAATIDVSSDTSATVRTGDTLVFHLLTWNYAMDAAAFGLPLYPSEVSFALVSAPLDFVGEFAATLESADRGVSVAFGDLTFGPGHFQGSGYMGDVSTLQAAYLYLAEIRYCSVLLPPSPPYAMGVRMEGLDPIRCGGSVRACREGPLLGAVTVGGWRAA